MPITPRDATARDALLDALCESAARPLAEARSLPPELYFRPDVYALEVERIFRREWLAVARADELSRTGDTVSVDVVGEPLVLTRDAGGALHALSRVCRHRGMDLLHGEPRWARQRQLQCPYHRWTYGLDGRLAGAPLFEGQRGFDAAVWRLRAFRVEVWQGFVFVNLDAGAPPLAPRMREAERLLDGMRLDAWVPAGVVAWGPVDVNWKVAVENGAECYHHLGTHRDSLQPFWPAQEVAMGDPASAEGFSALMRVSRAQSVGPEGGARVQPTFFPAAATSPRARSGTLLLGVFPLFLLAVAPDHVTWFRWLPTGPESHVLDIVVLVAPEAKELPDFDARAAELLRVVREVQTEDAAANAAVQRGLRAAAARPGPLGHLEAPLWQLQRYLAARLVKEAP